MSRRYRLCPTPAQEIILREHCAHARYVWNLAWYLYQCGTLETYGNASRRKRRDGTVYIHQKRRPVRNLPGYNEQCKMLTEARAEHDWLRAGSQMVQQHALRDFDQAMQHFYTGLRGRPGRRKRNVNEGFRITGVRGHKWEARRLSRHVGEVRIPKVGWVRFRWSRPVPDDAKSFRVTVDRSGRWHVAFSSLPPSVPFPRTGEVVGVDCGVTITVALSTGEKLHCPNPSTRERARLRKAQRRMARRQRGSPKREVERRHAARLLARDSDRLKDWCEKTSTEIARRFDVIRVEDLDIPNMTRSAKGTVENPGRNIRQKAGLNRAIQGSGWGLLVRRLEQKAPGRVEKVNPAYTSQRCSACGHVDAKSRESQADFVCTACGFACNADVNAAKNIAAGHAGGLPSGNREPLIAGISGDQESSLLAGGEDANVRVHG